MGLHMVDFHAQMALVWSSVSMIQGFASLLHSRIRFFVVVFLKYSQAHTVILTRVIMMLTLILYCLIPLLPPPFPSSSSSPSSSTLFLFFSISPPVPSSHRSSSPLPHPQVFCWRDRKYRKHATGNRQSNYLYVHGVHGGSVLQFCSENDLMYLFEDSLKIVRSLPPIL